MKKRTIGFLLLSAVCLMAGMSEMSAEQIETPARKVFPHYYEGPFARWYFGIHTGIDIGGAVPYPLSSMGEDNKVSAAPNLFPELGISGTLKLGRRWSVGVEATYKRFGIDARARVNGQGMLVDKVNDMTGEIIGVRQEFSGMADMDMNFAMLEVPVYVGYRFKTNRLLFGLYYGRVFNSHFSTKPLNGLLQDSDGNYQLIPEGESFVFDARLDNWDIGMMLGYEWKVIERVNLSARFSMGFKDIFERDKRCLDYKMLHMRGSLILSYRILGTR